MMMKWTGKEDGAIHKGGRREEDKRINEWKSGIE
jgi:hypothetical protein